MSTVALYPEVYTWNNQATPASIAYAGATPAYQAGYVMAGYGYQSLEWNYLGDSNGWVRFNLSSIPTGSTINSVTISFDIVWEDSFGAAWNGYIGDMYLYKSTNITWDESTLTWNNAPSVEASYSGTINWNCNGNEQGSARSQQSGTKTIVLTTSDITNSLSAGKISYKFTTNGILWSMNYDGIRLDIDYTAGSSNLPTTNITTDSIRTVLNLISGPTTFGDLCTCASVNKLGLDATYCSGTDASARLTNLRSTPYEIAKFRNYNHSAT